MSVLCHPVFHYIQSALWSFRVTCSQCTSKCAIVTDRWLFRIIIIWQLLLCLKQKL